MSIFDKLESEVRGYCRDYPIVFARATGSTLIDESGEEYLDFLGGAGTLNYGHNNPEIKRAVIDYLEDDGVLHGLDMHTRGKERFMEVFNTYILEPRGLEYKMQFTGPTGTNAVEAAMKLARKITGRTEIVSFTNGFHGMTLGAVAATGNSHHRGGAGVPLSGTTFMPYAGYFGSEADTIAYIEQLLEDPSSGVELPAAMLIETVQGEGGVNVASAEWMQRLQKVCRNNGILLIVDDIQVGCGRTGTFFSWEEMDIDPDIVVLSKSLGGIGLPMALVLMKPEHDQWAPGEHNGTFRGNNLAFVAATKAIELYWRDEEFSHEIKEKGANILIDEAYKGKIGGWGEWKTRIWYGALQTGQDPNNHRELRPRRQCDQVPGAADQHPRGARDRARSSGRGDRCGLRAVREGRVGGEQAVKVVTLDEVIGSERDVHAENGNWNSRRLLLKADGMGFSLHDTLIHAGTETLIHYQNHLEAVYCIEGEGEVETTDDGKIHPISAGTVYALDKHDRHLLRARKTMRMICVFNPAITGNEVHDQNGVYPLADESIPETS